MNDARQTTELIAVRHGQTEWNTQGRIQGHHDSRLTELGMLQADGVAEALACDPVDALYSSDLGRARQTAVAIAARLGREIVLEPGLRERRFGAFEGLTWSEIRVRYPSELDAYEEDRGTAPPGGESSRQRHDRVVACVRRLADRHVGGRIVLVAHGGTLQCLFKYAVGLRHDAVRQFSVHNASINRLSITEGAWKVEVWGDTHHLRALGDV